MEKQILLLDGGFGTTLEDVFGQDISSPLWSASLIDNEPDIIIKAHNAFLTAGSDIILTSTYQCSFETFHRSGYQESDAIRLMRKGVSLAGQARREYDSARDIKIALSLGPYGASMTTAQEFTGFYPPPYGPKAFSPSALTTNAFEDDDTRPEKESKAESALEEFHFRRLKVFADNPDTWAEIDYVAFETVPLVREIQAIRRAMGRLLKDLSVQRKPWWISTVWPDGKFPQECVPGGERLGAKEVTAALFDNTTEAPIPNGIGVNCTGVEHLGIVVKNIRQSTEIFRSSSDPFLVLYPNGGVAYDTVNRSWAGDPKEGIRQQETWAERLANVVKLEQETRAWMKVIVGGCCKTGPRHIEELRGLFP